MSTQTTGAEEIAWDLSDLYESAEDPRLEKDIEAALEEAKAFRRRHHGKVAALDAKGLGAAVSELEELASRVQRAFAFARLIYSTDTSDEARGALLQKLQERATALQTELLFFELEWINLDDEKAERILADPAVERYRHYLESKRRYRPYVLTEPEEKILSEKSVSGSDAWARLFTELISALEIVIDGEKISFEEALSRMENPDREVRRKAAEGITTALSGGLRTRSFILNTVLLDKSTDDRLRRYPSWVSSRNLANEASDESVQALVDAVVSRYDIPQRYYALKARLLGLGRLADYDRLAPISTSQKFVPWEEAKRVVLNAYNAFSGEAGGIIRKFFEQKWIDAPVRQGKEPGAFCTGPIPDVHPYVLLNYTGERRSILVLAHELGHGLHGFLAQDKGLFNAHTPLTLAETASVFGEALTFRRLLEAEADPKARLDLLAGRIDDTIATIFRQVAMNRFEDTIHNTRRGQGEISVDRFAEFWADTQTAMLGEAVEVTEGYRSWWSYIPHIVHVPGYVYAYAFGYLFSLAIFQKYLQEGEPFVGSYLDLLRAGGSDKPEVLAKIVGLDITDPGFWASGLEIIDGLLKEAEQLAT